MKTRKWLPYFIFFLCSLFIFGGVFNYSYTELLWHRTQENRAKLVNSTNIPPEQKRVLEYFDLAKNFKFNFLHRLYPELDIEKRCKGAYKSRRDSELADESAMNYPLSIVLNDSAVDDLALEERLVVYFYGRYDWKSVFELRFTGAESDILDLFLGVISLLPSNDFKFAQIRDLNGYVSLVIVYRKLSVEGSIYPAKGEFVGFWCVTPFDVKLSPDFNAKRVFDNFDGVQNWAVSEGINFLKNENVGMGYSDYYGTPRTPAPY